MPESKTAKCVGCKIPVQRVSKYCRDCYREKYSKGEYNPFFGRTHSEDTKDKIRIKKIGIHFPGNGFKKGSVPWNRGIPMSEEAREKASRSRIGLPSKKKGKRYFHLQGEKNPHWKGENVGYYALHSWVSRNLGKPENCENCGIYGLKGHKIHWANISRQYFRRLDDWVRLCAMCHIRYDKGKIIVNHNYNLSPESSSVSTSQEVVSGVG